MALIQVCIHHNSIKTSFWVSPSRKVLLVIGDFEIRSLWIPVGVVRGVPLRTLPSVLGMGWMPNKLNHELQSRLTHSKDLTNGVQRQ